MSRTRLAFVLAMTVALGPFAIDAYLPAFPAIAASLGATVHEVSLSISAYIMALALGQLIGGPMADRYGRQRVMLSGLVIFSLASLLLWRVESLEGLLFLRAVQAFGAGWATACVPALVRDQVQGVEAAKMFSLIALIMIGAPAVAPSLGSAILLWSGWNTIFLFLAGYSLALVGIVKLTLFSGHTGTAYRTDDSSFLQRYKAVITTTPALRFIFIQATAFSAMMLFVTHSSFIYQQHFGVSASLFGLLFGANIVAMAVVNITNRKLLNVLSPLRIMKTCLALQFAAMLFLLAVAYWQLGIAWFVAGTVATIGLFGGISPNNQACYMEFFQKNGGTAGALMGAIQFSAAGAVTALSALLHESLLTVVLAQVLCCTIGFVLAGWPTRTVRPAHQS